MVRFFFIEVKVRFLNSIFKFAEAEWGVSLLKQARPGCRVALAVEDENAVSDAVSAVGALREALRAAPVQMDGWMENFAKFF